MAQPLNEEVVRLVIVADDEENQHAITRSDGRADRLHGIVAIAEQVKPGDVHGRDKRRPRFAVKIEFALDLLLARGTPLGAGLSPSGRSTKDLVYRRNQLRQIAVVAPLDERDEPLGRDLRRVRQWYVADAQAKLVPELEESELFKLFETFKQPLFVILSHSNSAEVNESGLIPRRRIPMEQRRPSVGGGSSASSQWGGEGTRRGRARRSGGRSLSISSCMSLSTGADSATYP